MNYCCYATCAILTLLHWLVSFAQIQSCQLSSSKLTNWPKTYVCLFTDITVHAQAVAINPVNGNQEKDLAAWRSKSFIDRLALIHAVIVKGFSYWWLSTLALKALTSGVKVSLWQVYSKTSQPKQNKNEENLPLLVWSCLYTLHSCCAPSSRKKKKQTWLGCQASQHCKLDRFGFSENVKPLSRPVICNLGSVVGKSMSSTFMRRRDKKRKRGKNKGWKM